LKPTFDKFHVETPESEEVIKKYLKDHAAEHLWDLALKTKPTEVVI